MRHLLSDQNGLASTLRRPRVARTRTSHPALTLTFQSRHRAILPGDVSWERPAFLQIDVAYNAVWSIGWRDLRSHLVVRVLEYKLLLAKFALNVAVDCRCAC